MSSKYAILIPAASRDNVADTLDSVFRFEPSATVIVLRDYDNGDRLDSRATVLPPLPWKRDGFGGLLQKKMWALQFLLSNSDAEIILSLDADALLIKSGVFPKVAEVFKDKHVGIAGCSRLTPKGKARDFGPVAKSIGSLGGIRSIAQTDGRKFIKDLLSLAKPTGYQLGEHALGGAEFFNRQMIADWSSFGWLQDHGLSKIPVPEDGVFGLMAYAAGYRIQDIGGPGGLVNIAWRGLPDSPKVIHDSAAFITHSVRFYEDLTEIQIRQFFKTIRANDSFDA